MHGNNHSGRTALPPVAARMAARPAACASASFRTPALREGQVLMTAQHT